MAVSAVHAQTNQTESKSALKKKKAKASSSVAPAVSVTPSEAPPSHGVSEGSSGDGGYESPYIKELYKNIRNVNKKIANASKVDNVIAENPGKSLDDLVAARKINADQKAQILKKPSLQATLSQYEEQIAQYVKFDREHKARAQSEKAEVERTLTERLVKEKEDAIVAIKAEAIALVEQEKHESLLLISRFLRLAAQRRADEEQESFLEENQALEALLFLFYDGEERAVETMKKYIQGSDEGVVTITGETLTTTYAQIKAASAAYAPPTTFAEAEAAEEFQTSSLGGTADFPVQSDPTMVNAGLTELDDGPLSNGYVIEVATATGVQQSDIGDGNAVAEANWDPSNNDMSTSQEWIKVNPRDAAETDTGVTATLAAPAHTQSWADETSITPPPATDPSTVPFQTSFESTAPTSFEPSSTIQTGDGFEQVNRNRGSRDGPRDGQYRGRGRGGDYRGGDFRGRGRGDFRGRGRGPRGGLGYRGDRGGDRGGRRSDES